ncbi:hypothetical protein HanOQP8_Chr00c020g0701411 [Helianthus annuus]|nr:hypothetical protein HanOQP8_Chr00c020g0701401 [Helianthus annuus]KAJ0807541.1 hypothetical protein HanOQP8_Chr00c020g0701411 [Helianthus annuus]
MFRKLAKKRLLWCICVMLCIISQKLYNFFVFIFIQWVQRAIDENEEKLKGLKRNYGEEVYKAVATAVTEINDYNPSGAYVTTELWNFNEGRRSTLKEGVMSLLEMWDMHKRRRNM